MHWPLDEVDSSIRDKLRHLSSGADLPRCPHYFRIKSRWTLLTGLALGAMAGIAIGALVTWNFFQEDNGLGVIIAGIITSLTIAWLLCIIAEMLRAAASPVRPFLLLTPRALIQCDLGYVAAFRLADATEFTVSKVYDRKQNFAGHRLDFTFPEGPCGFVIKERLSELEPVLERARAGASDLGACGLDLIPATAGRPRRPAWRQFTDPVGQFWAWPLLLAIVLSIGGAFLYSYLHPKSS